MNCKSRKRLVEKSKETKFQSLNVDSSTVSLQKDTVITTATKQKESEIKKSENIGEVDIKGNTDSEHPFEYHNVVDGDTLSSISIKGQADFKIKNNWKNTKEKESTKESESNLNIVAKIARKAVSKETIEEVATKAITVREETKTKGFHWPIYLILGVVAVVAIIAFFAVKYFKR